MSAASELRKALKDLKYPLSQGGVIVRQWQSDEVVDATLDAVIASLPPTRVTDGDLNMRNHGFDEAVEDITELLQSAKTQKGEE